MPVGKNHRIVIEVDPDFKEQIYTALRAGGLTLKGWFTEQVLADIVEDAANPQSQNQRTAK